MEKITARVLSKVRSVKKNLELILDEDKWTHNDFEISRDYFSLNSSLTNLPLDKSEKSLTLFGNLSSFFSSGIFLYKQATKDRIWTQGSAFKNGKFKRLSDIQKSKGISLPQMKNGELRKTSPYVLLSQIDLCSWSDGTDSTAFVLQLNEHFVFLLFIDLPEPWLRFHIEKLYNAMAPCFELSDG